MTKDKTALETLLEIPLLVEEKEVIKFDPKQVKPNLKILTEEQRIIVDSLISLVSGELDCDVFLVDGPAGVGKTFTLATFVHWLIHNSDLVICFAAPTHKAVNVGREMSPISSDQVWYKTTYSLLALKETYTDEGEIKYLPNEKQIGNEPIQNCDVVIVDESSMIRGDHLSDILAWRYDKLIIFVGDSAQIPPVKGSGKAPVFSKKIQEDFNFQVGKLTKVMRQALESPVLKMATEIRQKKFQLPEHNYLELSEANSGVFCLNPMIADPGMINEVLLKLFKSREFEKDSTFCRIIAYHNKDVNQWNNRIRKLVYGESVGKLEQGETIVLRQPIVIYNESERRDEIVFPNNQELKIIDPGPVRTIFCDGIDSGHREPFKFYSAKVEGINPSTGYISQKIVRVLHEDDEKRYKFFLASLKKTAKKMRKGYIWKKYYDAKKIFIDFLYGFAITAHKSQGSTYKISLLVWYDLKTSPPLERNALLYVAASRASQYNIIITK